MTVVSEATVLAAAQAAAALLPPPANAIAGLIVAVARAAIEAGCTVEGCADVDLAPADAPDLLTQALDARMRRMRVSTGTDKASVEAALRSDADELPRVPSVSIARLRAVAREAGTTHVLALDEILRRVG